MTVLRALALTVGCCAAVAAPSLAMGSVPRPPMHRFGMAYAGDQDGWVFEGATARGRDRYVLRFSAPTCDVATGVCGAPQVQWSVAVTAVRCPGDYWIFRVPGGRAKCLRPRFVG